MRLLALLLLLPLTSYAEIFYVTQSGAGSQDGTAIGNAWSVANFDNTGNWGATAGEINAGDTVCFSGTITSHPIDIHGDGVNGNPITIDGGCAAITAVNFSWSGATNGLNIVNDDYIHINNVTVSSSDLQAFQVKDSTGTVFTSPDITVNGHKGINIAGTVGTIEIQGPGCHLESDEDWTVDSVQGDSEGIAFDAGHTLTTIKVHNCHIQDWGHTGIKLNGNYTSAVIYENLFDRNDNPAYGRAFSAFPSGGSNNGDELYFFRNKIDGMRTAPKALARKTYIYNNYLNDSLQRCWFSTDAGCTFEYHIGGSDTQKEKHNAVGRSMNIISNNDTFLISTYLMANNTATGSTEQCLRNQIDPIEHTIGTDSFKIINNVFLNCGTANTFADDPPGSNDASQDGKIAITTANWPANSGDINNNLFFGGDSDDLAYSPGSLTYTAADINADNYVPGWSGSGNITTDPGLTAGGYPDSGADNVVDAGIDPGTIPDPNNVLPANASISYGLDGSSVWPDSVVILQQVGSWDIGAFPYVNQAPAGLNAVGGSHNWYGCGGGITRPTQELCP